MRRYAVINELSGAVENVIVWDGVSEWLPPAGCIVIESNQADVGWAYIDGEFVAPPPMDIPDPAQPTAEELREYLMDGASEAIAPLQDAVDVGEATAAEEASLLAWKRYRVVLNRLPQLTGWPDNVEWPTKPE